MRVTLVRDGALPGKANFPKVHQALCPRALSPLAPMRCRRRERLRRLFLAGDRHCPSLKGEKERENFTNRSSCTSFCGRLDSSNALPSRPCEARSGCARSERLLGQHSPGNLGRAIQWDHCRFRTNRRSRVDYLRWRRQFHSDRQRQHQWVCNRRESAGVRDLHCQF